MRRGGEVILDRAIGHAKGNGPRDDADAEKVAATPETPFCVYSTSKAVTAFVVHKLCERGLVDLDDPVADYIPGYEANRKDTITIGHVLAHRAGVPNLPRDILDLDHISDRDRLTKALVDAKPFAKPGRLLAYHAVSGGLHPRRGRPLGDRQGHPRGARPRSSSTRSGSGGRTTASPPRTSTRSRSTT